MDEDEQVREWLSLTEDERRAAFRSPEFDADLAAHGVRLAPLPARSRTGLTIAFREAVEEADVAQRLGLLTLATARRDNRQDVLRSTGMLLLLSTAAAAPYLEQAQVVMVPPDAVRYPSVAGVEAPATDDPTGLPYPVVFLDLGARMRRPPIASFTIQRPGAPPLVPTLAGALVAARADGILAIPFIHNNPHDPREISAPAALLYSNGRPVDDLPPGASVLTIRNASAEIRPWRDDLGDVEAAGEAVTLAMTALSPLWQLLEDLRDEDLPPLILDRRRARLAASRDEIIPRAWRPPPRSA